MGRYAYAAVRFATGGHFWTDSIKRQMFAHDNFSPIIIQTGREADYGTFEKFQKAILKAPLKYDNDKLEYKGPSSPRIEFFTMRSEERKAGKAYILPLVDGKAIDLNPEYAYSSPYMQNKAGSEIVTVTYGGRTWKYDFDENTVTEAE